MAEIIVQFDMNVCPNCVHLKPNYENKTYLIDFGQGNLFRDGTLYIGCEHYKVCKKVKCVEDMNNV